MRGRAASLVAVVAALAAACARAGDRADTSMLGLAALDARASCDAGGLPPRASRDDASHTLTVTCDGAAASLAIRAYDDGVVRLLYGQDGGPPGGSIVPLDPLPQTAPLRTGEHDGAAVLCTLQLAIAVQPGTCRLVAIDVATGATILDDGADGGFGAGVGVTRAAAAGERFYGLGLHTAVAASRSGLDLRGRTIDLYNTDAYDGAFGGFRPDANPVYESIPFYAGLRNGAAYGVFTDNTHRMTFDFASDGRTTKIRASGGAIDQYLIAGPALHDVVRRFTGLTGRTPLPPPWALGFQQSRWEAPCDGSSSDSARPFCSAAGIGAIVERFRDDAIPLDGVFLDIQHMDGFRSFTFDPARFPDPAGFVAGLSALGVHVSEIVDPGIKQDPGWPVYDEGLAGDHFLRDGSGVFVGQVWPGAAVFPDFSAAKTRAWWSGLVSGLASRGTAGAWIDMNEPSSFTTGTVPDQVLADGNGHPTTMAEVHNAYGWFEAKATYEGLAAARPTERPFVLSRAAFAGQQRWSAVWTGDAPSTWTTLAMTLPQLLELGLSGVTFAGSDVGGYSGRDGSTADLFTRWMAVGAISPFFRAHAASDARRQEPWSFGPDAEDAVRELVRLRYELMPYLYSLFDEAMQTGAPVLRPLVFEFQDDTASQAVADEAMLGPFVLAAPVLGEASTGLNVYLPPGRWFELRSGAVFEGGKTVAVDNAGAPLPAQDLPLFAHEGAIVPRTVAAERVLDTKGASAPLLLDVFPGPKPTSLTLLEDDGAAFGGSARVTFTLASSPGGARLEAGAPVGTYTSGRPGIVVRVRRVDRGAQSVSLDGVPLVRDTSGALPPAEGTFAWDENDRALVVALPNRFPFSLDLAYDASLDPDGTVEVPVHVTLPVGTPAATPIAVASSAAAWSHLPLTRSGDEATGTVRAPRGGWASFKVTRGDWSTVEKGVGCTELPNRSIFGAGARPAAITVRAWADSCP